MQKPATNRRHSALRDSCLVLRARPRGAPAAPVTGTMDPRRRAPTRVRARSPAHLQAPARGIDLGATHAGNVAHRRLDDAGAGRAVHSCTANVVTACDRIRRPPFPSACRRGRIRRPAPRLSLGASESNGGRTPPSGQMATPAFKSCVTLRQQTPSQPDEYQANTHCRARRRAARSNSFHQRRRPGRPQPPLPTVRLTPAACTSSRPGGPLHERACDRHDVAHGDAGQRRDAVRLRGPVPALLLDAQHAAAAVHRVHRGRQHRRQPRRYGTALDEGALRGKASALRASR